MLKAAIITVHPAIVDSYASFGVLAAATRKSLLELTAIDLRDFAVDKHASVDDSPYGGGDGMVLRPEPLADAIDHLSARYQTRPLVITTAPGAPLWTQRRAQELSVFDRPIAFVCGRFGGIDERFLRACVDEEYSVGDFVVSGGELPALLMLDSMTRWIPGVLGHGESAANDSFGPGCKGLLEHPLYTRPPVWRGDEVPAVLLSGDHAAIRRWREEKALEKTRHLRPDLLK
jgi:tRNA (guanine37-N1)-methyltransferase